MATASLMTDYYECVSLYNTFINKIKKVSPNDQNISGVESFNHKGGGQKKCKGGSGGAMDDVYYSKEEYSALSSDQRELIYKKTQAKRHKPTEKKVKYKGGGTTDDMVKQVSALVSIITSASETPGTAPPTTISKNPALKRHRILCE